MQRTNELTVQERGDAKPAHLRRDGITPIGLVQKGQPTRKVQAETAAVQYALTHAKGAGVLQLKIDGEPHTRTVFIKQIDRLGLTSKILNVVLAEVGKNEAMTAEVPVHAVGTPPEVAAGTGVLANATSTLKIKGKPDALPASIDVDVSHLVVGAAIHAGEITLPDGVELASPPDHLVFSIQHLRAVELEPVVSEAAVSEAAPEAAPGAEPEAEPTE